MHALVNRALRCFLRDSHGATLWAQVAQTAGVPESGGAGLGRVDPARTEGLVAAAAAALHRDREGLLEDLGTYLVSHPNMAPMRRLLRYGGICFVDFLHALPDLPDRARLAVPDLALPSFDLRAEGQGRYVLRLGRGWPGVGPIVVGALRALADDYGTLAMLVRTPGADGDDSIAIDVVDTAFASGRAFELAVPAVAG